MAVQNISWLGVVIRFVVALILVFATYNPDGFSFYHWGILHFQEMMPVKVFAGVVLLIGWTIFIRATIHSLGVFGSFLVVALVASLLWVVVDQGWIALDNMRILSYVIMVLASIVLTTGMSWSHIRRRLSGQYDVDDTDTED